MRTDLKIGIVTGLVILVAVVAYLVFTDSDTPSPEGDTVRQTGAQDTENDVVVRTDRGTRGDSPRSVDVVVAPPHTEEVRPITPRVITPRVIPPAPSPVPAPVVGESREPRTEADGGEEPRLIIPTPVRTPPALPTPAPTPVPSESNATGGRDTIVALTPRVDPSPAPSWPAAPTPTPVPSPLRGPDPSGGLIDMSVSLEPIGAGSAPPPGMAPVGMGTIVPGSVSSSAGGEYVVQEGDLLWSISERLLGHGKHWELIAKANPSINPNALSPGTRLKIPALPGEAPRPAAGTPGTPEGTIARSPSGQRVYVVKEGDAGFWGIAAKPEVYGDGRLWERIKNANPDIDPTSLKIGTQLVIPPPPGADAATGATSGSTRTDRSAMDASNPSPTAVAPTDTVPGRYIVQDGDAGFWGIARKVYGDGALWPAIEKSNPGADSSRLKVGQVLIVPSKLEAQRLAGVRSGTSTSSGGSTPTPVPVAPPSGGGLGGGGYF